MQNAEIELTGVPREKRNLFPFLEQRLAADPFWTEYLSRHFGAMADKSLHVGIFVEPFLGWIFDGKKKVESRFSKNEIAPYKQIDSGDVLLLKEAGKPITGIARAGTVWCYRLDPKTWSSIQDRFTDALGIISEDFWEARQEARFATLISLDHVTRIAPVPYEKNDRRGWVIEHSRRQQLALEL